MHFLQEDLRYNEIKKAERSSEKMFERQTQLKRIKTSSRRELNAGGVLNIRCEQNNSTMRE